MLSSRAQRYLANIKREENIVCDRDSIISFFNLNKIPIYESVIVFYELFSGYTLGSLEIPENTFETDSIPSNYAGGIDFIIIQKHAERILFRCGWHSTAQESFYITEKGEFCTWDEGGGINILNEKFETFVESYAFNSELSKRVYYPYAPVLEVSKTQFDETVAGWMIFIPECSDRYNSCWKSEKIICNCQVSLSTPFTYYLSWSGLEAKDCDEFHELLIVKSLIA